jgi:YbgC/YbaW family acyl-CoA thioester hydrolase
VPHAAVAPEIDEDDRARGAGIVGSHGATVSRKNAQRGKLSVECGRGGVEFGAVTEPSQPAAETPSVASEMQVMFFDTDCAGVVNNIVYLRFIEIARTHLAEQLGMSLADMARTQLFPVVVRTEIDYRKPAVLGDKLVVHGRLEGVDRLRFWCAFEIRRPADGALIATSRQMLAVIQMPAGKPVRLPADWATRFAHLPVVRPATR